jgi:hypothetical protein
MADRLLFISWSRTVRGREVRALEVFNEALAFYGRCQNEGLIESFDVALLGPSGAGSLGGYIEVHGSADQLAALRENAEFMRNIADALLIVDDLAVVDGFANQGVAEQMAIYQEAIAQVPQLT